MRRWRTCTSTRLQGFLRARRRGTPRAITFHCLVVAKILISDRAGGFDCGDHCTNSWFAGHGGTTLGDHDGDGVGDLAVGATGYADGAGFDDRFGVSIGSLDDLDGDGVGYLAVGPRTMTTGATAGARCGFCSSTAFVCGIWTPAATLA